MNIGVKWWWCKEVLVKGRPINITETKNTIWGQLDKRGLRITMLARSNITNSGMAHAPYLPYGSGVSFVDGMLWWQFTIAPGEKFYVLIALECEIRIRYIPRGTLHATISSALSTNKYAVIQTLRTRCGNSTVNSVYGRISCSHTPVIAR